MKTISQGIASVTACVLAAVLAACGSSAAATERPLPQLPLPPLPGPQDPPGLPQACDTTPVTLDLRSPYTTEPLGTADSFPTGNEFLAAIPYTYLLHVPANLPAGPVPLLVAMHGLGGSGPQFHNQAQWARHAGERGFIVVFPTGPRRWDFRPTSLDVPFIRAIVKQVRGERCIDARRIWATGHSMGGFMTQRLACESGDLFAAGADSSGGDVSMPVLGGDCDAGANPPAGYEPVPLAFWHGDQDQIVNYERLARVTWEKWIERYQCQTLATDTSAPYGAVEVYGHCGRADIKAREAATGRPFQLRFKTYAGHKHGYPDGCGGLGEGRRQECTPQPQDWPTVDFHDLEILEFLYSHPRSTPAAEQP